MSLRCKLETRLLRIVAADDMQFIVIVGLGACLFEYLLERQHPYWTDIPNDANPALEAGRDGVLPEDDMALRALVPHIRPKRGRRTWAPSPYSAYLCLRCDSLIWRMNLL